MGKREAPPGLPVLAACAVLIYAPRVIVSAACWGIDRAHRLLLAADDNLFDFPEDQ